MWLDVRVYRSKTIREIAFYRPPNQSPKVDELMVDEVNTGCTTRQTIILGDFNLKSKPGDCGRR